MKSFYSVIMSVSLLMFMSHTYAGNAVDVPLPHKHKHAVPDSTSHGDYLEPQDHSTTGGESLQDDAAPGNAKEKSQRFKKEPEQGGTDVKQKSK